MKYGHTTGTRKERKGASDWYKNISEAHIARIEAKERTLHMATTTRRTTRTARTLATMTLDELAAALADTISELSRDGLKPSVKKALGNQMARIKVELSGREAPAGVSWNGTAHQAQPGDRA